MQSWMKAPYARIWIAGFAVAALGLIMFVNSRVSRNDQLLGEARFLALSLHNWQRQIQTNPVPILPTYAVNNREATVTRIEEVVTIDGVEERTELGWTNSCLGPGTLIITSNKVFLWREPDGETRKLRLPNLSQIPFWWYLTNP